MCFLDDWILESAGAEHFVEDLAEHFIRFRELLKFESFLQPVFQRLNDLIRENFFVFELLFRFWLLFHFIAIFMGNLLHLFIRFLDQDTREIGDVTQLGNVYGVLILLQSVRCDR